MNQEPELEEAFQEWEDKKAIKRAMSREARKLLRAIIRTWKPIIKPLIDETH